MPQELLDLKFAEGAEIGGGFGLAADRGTTIFRDVRFRLLKKEVP